MANRIVSVHVGIYGMGIYAIMLPSGVFSVAHSHNDPDRNLDCNPDHFAPSKWGITEMNCPALAS